MNKLVNKKKIIGIIGGMGPLAGLKLHDYIIKNTKTNGTDQDHMNVCHISKSSIINDRTDFINNNKINPSIGAIKVLSNMYSSNFNKELIVGVPCNTFHYNKIWDPFIYDSFEKFGNKIKILNMLQETKNHIKEFHPEKKNISILSTTGSFNTKIYINLFNEKKYNLINPESMDTINESIYNKEWGIKSTGTPASKKVIDNIENEINNLINKGSELIILGCSELPLAVEPTDSFQNTNVPIIDPLNALSIGLIREYLK